jgi:hypothetical protein
VTIEQNALVVTFSIWNLTLTCAAFAFMLLAALLIIYLLIRYPLWGLETIANIADAISG